MFFSPNLAERVPLLEETALRRPKEIPVKAAPMKGILVKGVPVRIPVKSMPYSQAISVQALSEMPAAIPIGERKMETNPVWIRMNCHREWSRWSNSLDNIVDRMQR